MLLLSDCRDGYPYLGTLSFYNAAGIQVVDEDVVVFFSSTTAANLQMGAPGPGLSGQMTKGILGTMPTVALTPDGIT